MSATSIFAQPLLTTVVGSMPQPSWLIDREMLNSRLPPRIRAREIWRVPAPFLGEAQDDATELAIDAMERAGLDIISDGEERRESYSNRFATALEGVDIDNPGTALDRTGHPNPVPRVVGPIRHTGPVMARDVRFAKRVAHRPLKITVPGPFTMAQQAQNDYYPDDESLAMAFAAAVSAELRALKEAGADMVQIDEPYLQSRPDAARRYALPAINAALEGIPGPKALHTCFGYAHIVHDRPSGYPFLAELAGSAATHIAIESAQQNVDPAILPSLGDKTVILGVIDLADDSPIEEPEVVAGRVRRALEYVPPERLWLAPDCGMKYLSRDVAEGKLRALVEGVGIVRAELGLPA
ncbi:MAG TPA: cobalamin-independent methionine synthase II family protein [Chloroflexota bacterium]|nr:cobalamin-independent methionine synthase II family protein [Chloroflexota bacterium]